MKQREIKFRGWYQETEKPTSFDKMYYSDRDYETLADFFKEYQIASIPTEMHKAVLMQYTGLKDKNGKDVFEGDNFYVVDDVVVETIGGYPRTEPEGRIETVKYERGAFWWGEELLWEVAEHGEVISNIYEDERSTK